MGSRDRDGSRSEEHLRTPTRSRCPGRQPGVSILTFRFPIFICAGEGGWRQHLARRAAPRCNFKVPTVPTARLRYSIGSPSAIPLWQPHCAPRIPTVEAAGGLNGEAAPMRIPAIVAAIRKPTPEDVPGDLGFSEQNNTCGRRPVPVCDQGGPSITPPSTETSQ